MHKRVEVGRVFGRVFEIYVDQAPVLMPTAAVVFVLTGLLAAVLSTAAPGLEALGLVIAVVATMLYTGMIVELVADVQDGRRNATVRGLLQAVMPVFGQLLLVGIVVAVCVLVGLALLILPGLILMTLWAVAAPVVVLEHRRGLEPLARSRELVRGNGWGVFGVILLSGLLVIVLPGSLQLAADAAGTGVAIVVRVIVGVLTAPLSALAVAVLYFELRRVEREAGAPSADALAGPGAP